MKKRNRERKKRKKSLETGFVGSRRTDVAAVSVTLCKTAEAGGMKTREEHQGKQKATFGD
jgi:hypothetical protein